MRRLVLGMSYEPHQPRELDLLHTEGSKTLLISDIVGERENGYERFMTNEKVIRDLNVITKAIVIDEYSYYRDLTLKELADRKFQYMRKEYPEFEYTYEEAEIYAKRHIEKTPNYLKNNKVNERVPFLEFNAPYLYSDDIPNLRKILFTEGMSNDRMLIITDAPKEKIEEWCYRYNDALENGTFGTEVTLFDNLIPDYYVKKVFDSEVDDIDSMEDVKRIGYDEEYDLAFYYREDPEPSKDVILHIRYKEPRNVNGAIVENDTITFCGIDVLKQYLRGEVTYDALDNTVKKEDNEVPVYACDAQGEVVWKADNARVVGHKGR